MDDKLRRLYEILLKGAQNDPVPAAPTKDYSTVVRGMTPDDFVKRYSDRGALRGFLLDLEDQYPNFFEGTSVDRVLAKVSPATEKINAVRAKADAQALAPVSVQPKDMYTKMAMAPEMPQDQTTLVPNFDIAQRKTVLRNNELRKSFAPWELSPMEEYAFVHPEKIDVAYKNAELVRKEFEKKYGSGQKINPGKIVYDLATEGGDMTAEQILQAKSIPGIDDEGLLKLKRTVYDHKLIVAEQEQNALNMRMERLMEEYDRNTTPEIRQDLDLIDAVAARQQKGEKVSPDELQKAAAAQQRVDALPEEQRKAIKGIYTEHYRTRQRQEDLDAKFPELKIISSLNGDLQLKRDATSQAEERWATEWGAKGAPAPLALALWRTMRGAAEIVPRGGEQLASTYNALAAIGSDSAKARAIRRSRRDVQPGTFRDSTKDMRPPYEMTAWYTDDATDELYEVGFDRDGKITNIYDKSGYSAVLEPGVRQRIVQGAEDTDLFKNHARTRINGSAMFNQAVDGMSDLAVTFLMAYGTGNLGNLGRVGKFLASEGPIATRVREALPIMFQYTGRMAEEGIAQGLSPGAAITYGALGSGMEALIEMASPFLGKMTGTGRASLKKSLERILADPKQLSKMQMREFTELALTGTLGEAGEELMAAYMQPITNKAINSLFDTNVLDTRDPTWQDYAMAGTMGALVAGLPGVLGGYRNARHVASDDFLKESIYNTVLQNDKVPEITTALNDPKYDRLNEIIQETRAMSEADLEDKGKSERQKVEIVARTFDAVKARYDAEAAKGTSAEKEAADEAVARQTELDMFRQAMKTPAPDERPLQSRVRTNTGGKVSPSTWTGLRPGDVVETEDVEYTDEGSVPKDTRITGTVEYVDPNGQYIQFKEGFRRYMDDGFGIYLPEQPEDPGAAGGASAAGTEAPADTSGKPMTGREVQARREDIERKRRADLAAIPKGPAAIRQAEEINRIYDAELADLEEEQKAREAAAQAAPGAAAGTEPATPGEAETEEAAMDRVTAITSASVKGNLSDGRKKQVMALDDEGKPIVEEEDFDAEDADVELDRLEGLAKRGKLTPRAFQSSYFGQSLDITTFKEASKLIEKDPASFVRKLREKYEGRTPEPKTEEKPDAKTTQPTETPAAQPEGATERDRAEGAPAPVPESPAGQGQESEAKAEPESTGGRFRAGQVVFRRANGRYEEYRVVSSQDGMVVLERPDGNTFVEAEEDLADVEEKAADTDTANTRFVTDDTVIFTDRAGKEYEVNFRGYVGQDKAVIVGRQADGIGQMQVDVTQLRGKPAEGGFDVAPATPQDTLETPQQQHDAAMIENDDALSGLWGGRRQLGKYIRDGIEYVRQKLFGGPAGKKGEVRFTSTVAVPFTYRLIEAAELQPSHSDGQRNRLHFIPEAQPKPRNDQPTIKAEDNFAQNPRFGELGANTSAYGGAPIVNSRGEVIQGNNRSAGLKKGYAWGTKTYKEDLAANAEEFGFTREQVEGMKEPILVREVNLTDAAAIEFGNYDVKDLETGSARALDPVATSRRVPFNVRGQMMDLLFSDPDLTLREALRKNTRKFIDMLRPYVTEAHVNTMLKDGEITKKGVDDIEALILHFLFDGGVSELPQLFEKLSYNQRQGIIQALRYIFSGDVIKSLVPQVQGAIVAANNFNASGMSWQNWLSQPDMFLAGNTPRDVYTPVELAIAEILSKDKVTQGEIAAPFREYSRVTRDMPGDMFMPPQVGLSKGEAIRQVFNVEYDETVEQSVAQNRDGKTDAVAAGVTEAPEQAPPAKGKRRSKKEAAPQAEGVTPPAAPAPAPAATAPAAPAPKTEPAKVPAEKKPIPVDKFTQLQTTLREVFGLNNSQAYAAAKVIDLLFRTMAKRDGVPLDVIYSAITFTKGTLLDAEAMVANSKGAISQETAAKIAGVKWVVEGRQIIMAFQRANITTAIHEVAHVFENYLTPEERKVVMDSVGHNDWTRDTSEAFARGFERYITEGLAPVPELQPIFDKLRKFFLDVYLTLFPITDISANITPQMRQLYARMLGYDVPPSDGRNLLDAPTVNKAKDVADFLLGDGDAPLFQIPGDPVAPAEVPYHQRFDEPLAKVLTAFRTAYQNPRNGAVVPWGAIAKFYEDVRDEVYWQEPASRLEEMLPTIEELAEDRPVDIRDQQEATERALRFTEHILTKQAQLKLDVEHTKLYPYMDRLMEYLKNVDNERTIKRLFEEEETGRRRGGEVHVGLSAVLQASARASEAVRQALAEDLGRYPPGAHGGLLRASVEKAIAIGAKEKEAAYIRSYAERRGIFHRAVDNPDSAYSGIDALLDSLYGPVEELEQGMESYTVYSEDTGYVVKAHTNGVNFRDSVPMGNSWISFLDRIALHNHYFAEAPITVERVIQDESGATYIVIQQPFVQAHSNPLVALTERLGETYMEDHDVSDALNYIAAEDLERRGFKVGVDGFTFTHRQNGVEVSDIYPGNFIYTPNGYTVAIDYYVGLNPDYRQESLVPADFEIKLAQEVGYNFPPMLGEKVMPDEEAVLFQLPGSAPRSRQSKDPSINAYEAEAERVYREFAARPGLVAAIQAGGAVENAIYREFFQRLEPYIQALPDWYDVKRDYDKYPHIYKAGNGVLITKEERRVLVKEAEKRVQQLDSTAKELARVLARDEKTLNSERLDAFEEGTRKRMGPFMQKATLMTQALERMYFDTMERPLGVPVIWPENWNYNSWSVIGKAERTWLARLAHEMGLFYPHVKATQQAGQELTGGAESQVFYNQDTGYVTKLIDPALIFVEYPNAGAWAAHLDRLTMGNHYFPETAYDVMGMSETITGDPRLLLRQAFVQSGNNLQAQTVAGRSQLISADLKARGFTFKGGTSYANDKVVVTDVRNDNIVFGNSGKPFYIDPMVIPNVPELGFGRMGGTRVISMDPSADEQRIMSQVNANMVTSPGLPLFQIPGEAPKTKLPSDILMRVETSPLRRKSSALVYVSPSKVLLQHRKDNPDFDVINRKNQIGNRVERAKEFIKQYAQDQRPMDPRTGERYDYGSKVTFEPSDVAMYNGKLSFGDGRHRMLAAMQLGLTAVPVEVPKEQAAMFLKDFAPDPVRGERPQGGQAKGQPRTLAAVTMPDVVNGFYSPLEERIMRVSADKQSANKWLNIAGKGDEPTWTGLRKWLEAKKPTETVAKKDILEFLKKNRIEVIVHVKTDDIDSQDYLYDLFNSYDYEIRFEGGAPRFFQMDALPGEDYIHPDDEEAEAEGADYLPATAAYWSRKEWHYTEINEDRTVGYTEVDFDELPKDLQQAMGVYGEPEYDNYAVKGPRTEYEEVLVALPEVTPTVVDDGVYTYKELNWSRYNNLPGVLPSREVIIYRNGIEIRNLYNVTAKIDQLLSDAKMNYAAERRIRLAKTVNYKGPHWDPKNVLVHVRGDMRQIEKGQAYFVQEIQSDWGETIRKQGVNTNEPIPDAVYEEAIRRREDRAEHFVSLQTLMSFLEPRDPRVYWNKQEKLTGQVRLLAEISPAERIKRAEARWKELERTWREDDKSLFGHPGFYETNDNNDTYGEALRNNRLGLNAFEGKYKTLIESLNFNYDVPQDDKDAGIIAEYETGLSRLPPPGPFVQDTNAWTKLGLRIALQRAIRRKADYMVITPGEQIATAVGAANVVTGIVVRDEIPGNTISETRVAKKEEGERVVVIDTQRGQMQLLVDREGVVIEERGIGKDYLGENIAALLGEPLAEKVMALDYEEGLATDQIATIGAGPMVAFYGSPAQGAAGMVGEMASSMFKQKPEVTTVTLREPYYYLWDNETPKEEWFKNPNMDSTPDRGKLERKLRQLQLSGINNYTIEEHVPGKYFDAYAFKITPELKRQVSDGLPLFQIPGQSFDDRKAPNGKPSNLEPLHYSEVRRPTFKNWFGDWEEDPKNSSVVKDENGEPLVVYHNGDFGYPGSEDASAHVARGAMHFGTKQAAIERSMMKGAEDMAREVEAFQDEETGMWHWEHNDGDTSLENGEDGWDSAAAATLAGREAAIKKGRWALEYGDWQVDDDGTPDFGGYNFRAFLNIRNPMVTADQGDDWEETILRAQANGHDGIIYTNQYEDKRSTSYITFGPTQIKSADHNSGAYATESPSVLFQIIGEKGAAALDAMEETLHRGQQLEKAREMEAHGREPGVIHMATGWERGFDGKWRYEIPYKDGKIIDFPHVQDWTAYVNKRLDKIFGPGSYDKLRREYLKNTAQELSPSPEIQTLLGAYEQINADYNLMMRGRKLRDLYDNPALYKAYPSLRDIFVSFEPLLHKPGGGAYYRTGKRITIGSVTDEKQFKGVLIHEIQHAIQHLEGFGPGGSPQSAWVHPAATDLRKLREELGRIAWAYGSDITDPDMEFEFDYMQEAQRKYFELKANANTLARNIYNRLSGEVESRNASFRAFFPEAHRLMMPLQFTEDTAREEQLLMDEAYYNLTHLNDGTEQGPLFQIPGEVKQEGPVLLAPNGKPTNLTADQYAQVRTPAFKRWFGDWQNNPKEASKLLDENGEPMVAYHGTNSAPFDVFNRDLAGTANDLGYYGRGFYFTFGNGKYSRGEAQSYGRNLMDVYLNTRKPFDMSALEMYKGAPIFSIGTQTMVFLKNLAEKFPDLADKITIDKKKWEGSTGNVTQVPISALPGMFKDYADKLTIRKVVSGGEEYAYGDVGEVEKSYENSAGETQTYKDRLEVGRVPLSYAADGTQYPSLAAMEADFVANAIEKYEGISADYHPEGYMTRHPEITEAIKSRGYDAIMQSPQGDEIVVFQPNQVKSATDNIGDFAADSDSILFQIPGQSPGRRGKQMSLFDVKAEVEVTTASGKKSKVSYTTRAPKAKFSGVDKQTLRRVWERDHSFQFNGTVKVSDHSDVAVMMRVLEDRSAEHFFATFVDKDGNTNIVWVGTGTHNQTTINAPGLVASALKFNAVDVYLVHNHPSGQVNPSAQDVTVLNAFKRYMEPLGMKVHGVIMDTLNEQYAVFRSERDYDTFDRRQPEADTPSFDFYNVTRMEALSQPLSGAITSSSDVAQFIYGLRFSALPKFGVLLLNQRSYVIGNHVFDSDPKKEDLLRVLTEVPTTAAIIMYGTSTPREFFNDKGMFLEAATAQLARVLDFVKLTGTSEDVRLAYESFSDTGKRLLDSAKIQYGTLEASEPLFQIPGEKKMITPDELRMKAIKDEWGDPDGYQVLLGKEVIGETYFDRSLHNAWIDKAIKPAVWSMDDVIGWNKRDVLEYFAKKYNEDIPLLQEPGDNATKAKILERLRRVAPQVIAAGMRPEEIYSARQAEMADAGVTIDDINAVLAAAMQPGREAPTPDPEPEPIPGTGPVGAGDSPVAKNLYNFRMKTSDETEKMQSGATWEDVFGQAPEGDQLYFVDKLNDMLDDGQQMIAIARQHWGPNPLDYGPPLFDLIRRMSDDLSTSTKKVVLLATLLGELQQAKVVMPDKVREIKRLENQVLAFYQYYMNIQGKRVAAGRLLRLYRDRFLADVYEEIILSEKERRAARAAARAMNTPMADTGQGPTEHTEAEKERLDAIAAKRSQADAATQAKKKKTSSGTAKKAASATAQQILNRTGLDDMGAFFSRLSAKSKNKNCP